jgi:hypothetical protein
VLSEYNKCPCLKLMDITIPLFYMEGKRERDLGVGGTA